MNLIHRFKIKIYFCYFLFITGCGLCLVNVYGLTQAIRPSVIDDSDLRFIPSVTYPHNDFLLQLGRENNEQDAIYSLRVAELISQQLIHIKWQGSHPEKYNQLIPIWENYFLYLLGKFADIPEYNRYHYSNYKRSLKRGIGICGDASMIMSQVLNENNINNQIIAFPGHVIINIPALNEVFDPDFGIRIPHSLLEIQNDPTLVKQYYQRSGYSDDDIHDLMKIYKNQFTTWRNTKHFITKKFYFEVFAYYSKWPFPFLLILIAAHIIQRSRRKVK